MIISSHSCGRSVVHGTLTPRPLSNTRPSIISSCLIISDEWFCCEAETMPSELNGVNKQWPVFTSTADTAYDHWWSLVSLDCFALVFWFFVYRQRGRISIYYNTLIKSFNVTFVFPGSIRGRNVSLCRVYHPPYSARRSDECGTFIFLSSCCWKTDWYLLWGPIYAELPGSYLSRAVLAVR